MAKIFFMTEVKEFLKYLRQSRIKIIFNWLYNPFPVGIYTYITTTKKLI